MQDNINLNGISSLAEKSQASPNIGYKDIFYQLEQMIGADVSRVNAFVQNGIISQDQGQYLLTQLAQKASLINEYKSAHHGYTETPKSYVHDTLPEQDSMALFNQEKPGFFDVEGRADVLNYIKGLDMDKDEILQVAQLIEGIENSAVDNYLKKSAYEKSLNDENALAKSKLTAYAQNYNSDGNFNRIFTREEIGNMSGEEFTKNEKAIMNQLKQGLIK